MQMVDELLKMFGLPEDLPVTIPGFHYRDPRLTDPGVLTLRGALSSCYDIRYAATPCQAEHEINCKNKLLPHTRWLLGGEMGEQA